MKKIPYDKLPILPWLVAETVCGREYTGQEYSARCQDQKRTFIIEARRKKMTVVDIKEFSEYADGKCRAAYEVKAKWFMDIVKSKSNAGRDQLYVWITHWLAAYLLCKGSDVTLILV